MIFEYFNDRVNLRQVAKATLIPFGLKLNYSQYNLPDQIIDLDGTLLRKVQLSDNFTYLTVDVFTKFSSFSVVYIRNGTTYNLHYITDNGDD